MAKYYVFPVKDGYAYFGIKVSSAEWGAFCPSPFGGNDEGRDYRETLKAEAAEESHNKIDLDGSFFTEIYRAKLKEDQKEDLLVFYYAEKFEFNPAAVVTADQRDKNGYKETTGDILKLRLEEAPHRVEDLANWMLEKQRDIFTEKQFELGRNLKGVDQFKASETVKAFAALANKKELWK